MLKFLNISLMSELCKFSCQNITIYMRSILKCYHIQYFMCLVSCFQFPDDYDFSSTQWIKRGLKRVVCIMSVRHNHPIACVCLVLLTYMFALVIVYLIWKNIFCPGYGSLFYQSIRCPGDAQNWSAAHLYPPSIGSYPPPSA